MSDRKPRKASASTGTDNNNPSSPRAPNRDVSNQATAIQDTSTLAMPQRHSSLRTAKGSRSNEVKFETSSQGSSDSSTSIDLDADLFETILFHMGEFGTYQKFLGLVAMIPFAVYFTWVYFAPMFLVITPQPFWCKVPELAFLSKEKRRALSAPGAELGLWDGCMVYQTDWNVVIQNMQPPSPGTPLVQCQNGWEYDYGEIPFDTVISERNWVCHRDKYVPTSQSAFFAGCLAGGILFGWMADNYGRVPALMSVNILGGLAGMATTLTIGEWDFILCRFIHGMAFDNCIMIAYILVLEYVGPQYRTFVANFPIVVYYGGASIALPWIAYFVASWRWFTFLTSLPMFIVLAAPWVMPESARWLASRGKTECAVQVLRKFERINKTRIPGSVMSAFITSADQEKTKEKLTFLSMFKSRLLRQTTVFMTVSYSLVGLVYDALVRLCESLGLNYFLTFTINAAAEIPSVIAVTILLDRLGRRNLTCGPVGIAAVFIIIAMCVPKGLPRVIFAVAARFLANLACTVACQWVTEVLPTPFRATGSASMHMAVFATNLLSPFIVYSQRIWSRLPFAILAVVAVISSAFSLLAPETKGLQMPQTIADAEKIIRENSLYGKVRGESIRKAFSGIQSATFMEPIKRAPESSLSLRLSRQAMNTMEKK